MHEKQRVALIDDPTQLGTIVSVNPLEIQWDNLAGIDLNCTESDVLALPDADRIVVALIRGMNPHYEIAFYNADLIVGHVINAYSLVQAEQILNALNIDHLPVYWMNHRFPNELKAIHLANWLNSLADCHDAQPCAVYVDNTVFTAAIYRHEGESRVYLIGAPPEMIGKGIPVYLNGDLFVVSSVQTENNRLNPFGAWFGLQVMSRFSQEFYSGNPLYAQVYT